MAPQDTSEYRKESGQKPRTPVMCDESYCNGWIQKENAAKTFGKKNLILHPNSTTLLDNSNGEALQNY